MGDWKLVKGAGMDGITVERNEKATMSGAELYNLKDDPLEKNDLARSRPAVVRELQAALRLHVQRAGATPWQPPERRQ